VVFVTAYDRYAVAAFEREAVDYLLKPVDGERLHAAVERARRRLRRSGPGELARGLGALRNGDTSPAERLLVMTRGRGVFIRTAEIEWIEAAGNAVRLHMGSEVHRLRGPLRRLLQRLDPDRFRRVGRSTVVNVDCVKEIQPWFHGDAVVRVELLRNEIRVAAVLAGDVCARSAKVVPRHRLYEITTGPLQDRTSMLVDAA
jgi:two-component system LytT family response regulator